MWVRRVIPLLFVLVVLWAVVAVVQLVTARAHLVAGRERTVEGRDAAVAGNLEEAGELLRDAQDRFERADGTLGGITVLPARLVPVARRNVGVLRGLAQASAGAAEAGVVLTEAMAALPEGIESLKPSGGGLPVETLAGLNEPATQADALLEQSLATLDRTLDVPAVAMVANARADLDRQLRPVAAAVNRGAALLDVLPQFMGSGGPRRYLFIAQNPAEARGTGGLPGAYSILTLHDGRFSFGRFEQIQSLPDYNAADIEAPTPEFARLYNRYGGAGFWLNINMTPDFPTAARAMEILYEKGTGESIDGVVAADPFALAGLLKGARPVRVPGFGPVRAKDVVPVLSNRAHDEIKNSPERKRLLGAVAAGAFANALHGSSGDPLRTVASMGEVVGGGHLLLWSNDPEVQQGILAAGVGGQLLEADGDYVALIGNAGSASKLDYYIDRDIAYDVTLQPDGQATARAEVRISNDAPTSGISHRVIGPHLPDLRAGEHRLILGLYGAPDWDLGEFYRSHGKQTLEAETELGHRVYTTVTEIPAKTTRTLTLTLDKAGSWERSAKGGRYTLTVQGQPTIRPTTFTATVRLPEGMRLAGMSPGMTRLADGRVRFAGDLSAVQRFDVRFAAPSTGQRLWAWLSRPIFSASQ